MYKRKISAYGGGFIKALLPELLNLSYLPKVLSRTSLSTLIRAKTSSGCKRCVKCINAHFVLSAIIPADANDCQPKIAVYRYLSFFAGAKWVKLDRLE